MKKPLVIIVILVLILVFFRGVIYRSLVNYKDVGTRTLVELTNEKLLQLVEGKSLARNIGIEQVVEIANEITSDELRFTSNQDSNNPNELINLGRANCVGYSKMFNSIANYLIVRNRLQDEIKAEHKIAHLTLLGMDIHQCFKKPFYKDHDFNVVQNTKTGRTISIDPSLSDYFRIEHVNQKGGK